MAIRIISGKIGSGKSFYAVNHVLKSYFIWCTSLDKWILKPSDIPVKIYTNIAHMKLGGDLMLEIEKVGGLKAFFSNAYQEEFTRNSNTIYIIDEAQSGEFFHRKFYDVNVFKFLQMHRHLGVDIYLITQDKWCLSKELRELAEYEIQAIRRSNNLGKSFVYKFYSGDECFKTKRVKRDLKVFAMYRSMIVGEGEKITSIAKKQLIYFGIAIAFAALLFKFGFMEIMGLNKKKKSTESVKIVKKIEPQKIKSQENNLHKIIGLVAGNYILKTPNGIMKVKKKDSDILKIKDYYKLDL